MSTNAKVPVVFYRYKRSPFATKIENVLLLKGVEHSAVDVPAKPPRTALADLLGVHYRRIPVLAIGKDVYCDTSLIASALEQRFPASDGYASLFPPRRGGGTSDTGLIKAFVMSYVDPTILGPASAMMPWDQLPPDFVQDRGNLVGTRLNSQAIVSLQPKTASVLSSHLSLLEEQLSDGRSWLFDTEAPGFADVSMYMLYSFIAPFPATQREKLLDERSCPNVIAWLARMADLLKSRRIATPWKMVSGEEAVTLISTASFQEVGWLEVEARRLGLTRGSTVAVAPADTGKDAPTTGALLGLDTEEVVIETKGSGGQTFHCHFPRLNYTIRPVKIPSKL